MSIIYEALRKIQNSSKGAFRANPNAPLKSVPTRRPSVKKEILFALAGITAGFFAVRLIAEPRKPPNTAPPALLEAVLTRPVSARVNAAAPIATHEETHEQKIPELILNGIVLSKDGNLALIQERILKVGDDVEGAVIEEITDKQVVLAFQNQKIVLKTK